MICDGTIKVLVLEDDEDDYRLIAGQLRSPRHQFVVDWATTLSSAIDRLGRHAFDVVLTDLAIPDSIGLETVAKLRKHCGQASIIVLTALEDDRMEREILEAGAQDYLVKGDFGAGGAVRALLHAVQRQQAMNEMQTLVAELQESKELLQEQAVLLKRKNLRLKKLYKSSQEFVDNVSHDFRTPMAVIKDYVTIISEGMVGSINDEQKAMLDKVNVRADDLNNMVDDLLDVSKLESGLLGAWRRNSRVECIVERIESLLVQRAEVKGVQLTIDCDDNLPEVYCDADKVSRVITNLAVNAIKFAGDPGRVRLWAEADPVGHQVVVGVTDNGPGIEKRALTQIFKRFHQHHGRVQAAVKGFGLGLNIAHRLCQLNLGKLSVRSQPGKGSTFSFTLPIADPPEVLRRWLEMKKPEIDEMELVEITLEPNLTAGESGNLTGADEFDAFLNCLLHRNDLLFRTTPQSWLLVMAVTPSESPIWFKRVKKEFERTNRNRPLGPLPSYRAEACCQWSSPDTEQQILQTFESVLKDVPGYRTAPSAVVAPAGTD
jgi:signal transduction histidine kinase